LPAPLVAPPVARAIGRAACRVRCQWATHRPCCRSRCLLGAPSVGHPSPALSVTPPVAHATCCPCHLTLPAGCAVSRATRHLHCRSHHLLRHWSCYLLRRWSHYLLRRWSRHLLLHLSHAPLVMPLVAPLVACAVGCTTCCTVGCTTCCAISHATCCTISHATCCSTCRMRRRLCHSSPALPVVPLVTPPVAPPVTCVVCHTTHSLHSSSCPRSHCRSCCLLPTPHVTLPVGCTIGQPPIARAVGRTATCCPCCLAPPVGCAICHATCSLHRLLCHLLHHLSRRLLPVPPVAPPIARSVCHATCGPCCLTLAQHVVCAVSRTICSLRGRAIGRATRCLRRISHHLSGPPSVRPPVARSCRVWGSVHRIW